MPTQNLEEIYAAAAMGENSRPDTIPAKPFLGKVYAADTVLLGATKVTSVHANTGVEGVIGGYSLDGDLAQPFANTLADYDTRGSNGEMLVKHNGPSELDDYSINYRGDQYGGVPDLNPYSRRDYISDAPGLEG